MVLIVASAICTEKVSKPFEFVYKRAKEKCNEAMMD